MSPTFRTLTAAAALCAVSAASAQETFKVAYIDPLSGPFANVGELMLTHTQYAIEDINAKGGVLNRPLKKCFSNASGTLSAKTRAAQTRLRSDCNGPSGRFAGPPAHFGRTYPWAHA